MSDELGDLAQIAAGALVSAIATDSWEDVKRRFAAVAHRDVFVTGTGGVEAFDAAGSVNCAGTPKVCAPLWTAAMPGSGPTSAAPAVADGDRLPLSTASSSSTTLATERSTPTR